MVSLSFLGEGSVGLEAALRFRASGARSAGQRAAAAAFSLPGVKPWRFVDSLGCCCSVALGARRETAQPCGPRNGAVAVPEETAQTGR